MVTKFLTTKKEFDYSKSPSLTFTNYDELWQSWITGMNTTMTYSNLNTSVPGYYYQDYTATDNGWYDLDFRIVFKVGDPQPVDNYPTKHIKYNYSTDWLDQLVNYETITYNSNGTIATQTTEQTYTYDDQGNPTNITNFMYNGTEYDHAVLDYDGRQLKEIKVYNSSQVLVDTISYTYNDQGYRTSKTVGGVTTEYHLQGDKVLLETNGTYAIIYTYDFDGKLISFNYDSNKNDSTKGIEYFYVRNQQGDITKIIDKNRSIVVEYMYDAWGKLLEIDGSLASTIGEINPYRYRGYSYDEEIDMYYLNSRFYDANVGRFINADGLMGSVGNPLGHNMYAYTLNNPVMYSDISGYSPQWIDTLAWIGVGLVVVAAVILTAGAAGFVIGGTLGAIAYGASFGIAIGAVAGASIGAAGGVGKDIVEGNSFGTSIWSGTKLGFGLGTMIGAVAGAAAGAVLGAFLGAAGVLQEVLPSWLLMQRLV
jgi:RHS repeat-associated protein